MTVRPDQALPRVTVVLASFNGAGFIEEQVTSILWQRAVDVTLYIRDDGSSDNTAEAIRSIQHKDPERVYMVRDALGPLGSASANFFELVKRVDPETCDYIAFADQDDVWMPNKLTRAVELMSTHKANGYSSNLIAFGDGVDPYLVDKGQPQRRLDYLFQGASAGCTYVLDSLAFRKLQIAIDGAPPPPEVSHDWVIYAICRSAGLKWVNDSTTGILYRQHPFNVYGAKRGISRLKSRIAEVQAGWYRKHILWMRAVLVMNRAESEVIMRIGRLRPYDRIKLATQVGDFRRRRVDRTLLAVALLCGLI